MTCAPSPHTMPRRRGVRLAHRGDDRAEIGGGEQIGQRTDPSRQAGRTASHGFGELFGANLARAVRREDTCGRR